MRSRAERIASRAMMRDERRDIRLLLADLTAEQWVEPSLCDSWTVRDVVAHLVAWDDLLLYRTGGEHLRALGRFAFLYAISFALMGRLNERLDRSVRHASPHELVRRFGADERADLKWLFDGVNPRAHLTEYVVHHQDIRRPLRLPRQIPADRLVGALRGVTQLPGVRALAWWRLRKRRWQATDVDWSAGRGPLVRAPGEEILMVVAGRLAAPANGDP